MAKDVKSGLKGVEYIRPGTASTDEGGLWVMQTLLSVVMDPPKARMLAHRLKSEFGGLRGLLDASPEDLARVGGLDLKAVSLIALIKPVASSYLKERIADRDIIKDHRDVINYLKITLSGEKTEKFFGLYLNSRCELLSAEVLHEGTLTHAHVYPRKVIELAIKHSASSVIFVHNHPSGDPTPSKSDYDLMHGLEEAAAAVDLAVLDHIIIGRNSHFSAKVSGWLFKGVQTMPKAAERDTDH